jgi:hypothetical protein
MIIKPVRILTVLLMSASFANAANTLSITSCSSSSVAFSWSVDTLDDSVSIEGKDSSENENAFEYIPESASGTVTFDFAANWGGTDNSSLDLSLLQSDEDTVTASCP